MKIIGIVGSRRRDTPKDHAAVYKAFEKVYQPGDRLVSGGCERGGDRFAEHIAKSKGLSITIHYPRVQDLDKVLLAKNPRAAYAEINYARNQLVADDAWVLIACVAPDRKGGTEDTIKRFLRRLYPTLKNREKLGINQERLLLA